jgi:hypothetical protein
MKHILILITLVVFLSCQEETPTDNSDDQIQTEYKLEELESDPDWVEVTDIDTTNRACINYEYYKSGVLCRDSNELKNLFSKTGEVDSISRLYCSNLNELEIDFNTDSFIMYGINYHNDKMKRKLFKNDKLKKYIYLAVITRNEGNLDLNYFRDYIKIPKVKSSYEFVFDSLRLE